jgi:hypothetical protein
MNSFNLLEGCWKTYNQRKTQNGQDPNFFSPEDLWELNYLIDMIMASKPHLDHLTIMLSVREGIRKTMSPRPRQHFINIVMDNLSARENQWLELLKTMGGTTSISSAASEYPFSFN